MLYARFLAMMVHVVFAIKTVMTLGDLVRIAVSHGYYFDCSFDLFDSNSIMGGRRYGSTQVTLNNDTSRKGLLSKNGCTQTLVNIYDSNYI